MRLLGQFQTFYLIFFFFVIRFHKYKKAQNVNKAIQFLTSPTKLDFVRIAVCTFPSLVGPV